MLCTPGVNAAVNALPPLLCSPLATTGYFGQDVAVTRDGKYFLVGAPGVNQLTFGTISTSGACTSALS
jgi:hypothetical protein